MKTRSLICSLAVLLTMGALLSAKLETKVASGNAMEKAANAFLATLSDEQKAKATFKFDDAERLNWH